MTKLNKEDLLKQASILFSEDPKEQLAKVQIIHTNTKSEGLARLLSILNTFKPAKVRAFATTDLGISLVEKVENLPSATELRKFYRTYKDVESTTDLDEIVPVAGIDCLSKQDLASLALVIGEHSEALCKRINKGFKPAPKRFGWWRSDIDPKGSNLYPVVVDVKGFNRAEFLKKLNTVETGLEVTSYRSAVQNPWGVTNEGFMELSGWVWTLSARQMIERGVLPSKAFYKFIMGKPCPTLLY